jgi:formate dehydrogenase
MIERGDWQVSDIARNAFDLEGKVVGTIGAGRIGYRVLQRLVPFDCKELLYYDYAPLPAGNYSTSITVLGFYLIIYPTAAAESVKARRIADLKVSSKSNCNLSPISNQFENYRNLSLRFVRRSE